MLKTFFTIIGLVGIGVVGRLLPHPPNATPLTALTLAGSKYVGRFWAVAIPLTTMFISDAVIGFYDWKILTSVYVSVALISILSIVTTKYPGTLSTVAVIISAPIVFFLVTNFAVWAFSPWYDKTIWGLLYAYELGLPFLRNMLLGDLVYASVLLGLPAVIAAHYRTSLTLLRMMILAALEYRVGAVELLYQHKPHQHVREHQ